MERRIVKEVAGLSEERDTATHVQLQTHVDIDDACPWAMQLG